MSNLSELLPAGAGGKQVDFVASGTLGNGVTVALNSDGTVTAVTGASEGAGTPSVFVSADTSQSSATFDSSSNKVVIAYENEDNSSYGTAVVGTVSGTSISFGTPVVFESASAEGISAIFDSNSNKVVIAYRDYGNSQYGTAIVGTVSGTSISFGTAVVFKSDTSANISSAFDSNSNKVVIAYQDVNNAGYGTAIIGTVSGTSISFGSEVVFESYNSEEFAVIFDSNSNKIVIAYRDRATNYGTAIVGTVSGTSISFGTAVVFNSAQSQDNQATYDSANGKVIIVYQDDGNSSYGTAIVGTVSGTSISFGTAAVFESALTSFISATYDSASGKVVIAYRDGGNSNYGTVIVGTVSGTSISFGTAAVFESAVAGSISATYDSASNKVVIAYTDFGNLQYGTSVVFTVGSTNSDDFIGITDQAIADTATGAVIVQGGVSEKVTGLTTGSDYYVQDDGSLSTTVSSVPAGRALSTTSILLEG